MTAAAKETFPDVGDPAPDFELPSTENTTVRLSDLRGEIVVLLFYPAAFSPVCSAEHPVCSSELPSFVAQGARMFGVSTDNTWALKAFASELNLHYPLLADFWPHGEVARAYGVFREQDGFSERANILLDEGQKVIWARVYPTNQLPDIKEVIGFLKG